VGVIAAGAIAVSSVAAIDGLRAEMPKRIQWLFHGQGAAAIAADPQASALLADAHPFVMMGANMPTVPASWNAVSFVSFTSYGTLGNAVADGRLPAGIGGVMYDYERWSFTPEDEQRNPARYLSQAAEIVHAKHLLFFTAPAANLVKVIDPDSPDRPYDAYLRLGIAADAARYADVFDIQAQGSERSTARYSEFVRQAAAQARAANPHVIVLAGNSTQPSGQTVTADDLVRAIEATRPYVDGYWLNVPAPSPYCPRCSEFRPDIAIEVLHRIERH